MTHVRKRLDARPIADLPPGDLAANLDNDPRALVTRTLDPKVRHGWQGPVIHHEVDVGHAQAGAVESDEEFVVLFKSLSAFKSKAAARLLCMMILTGFRHIHLLDLDFEVRPFVHHYAGESLLGDFFGHCFEMFLQSFKCFYGV